VLVEDSHLVRQANVPATTALAPLAIENARNIEIHTGVLEAKIPHSGTHLLTQVTADGCTHFDQPVLPLTFEGDVVEDSEYHDASLCETSDTISRPRRGAVNIPKGERGIEARMFVKGCLCWSL
jgi:hypothetical protein